jgi:hypothetical protein
MGNLQWRLTPRGEMAERLKATVSKTVVGVSSTMGSNPILSATSLSHGLVEGFQARRMNAQMRSPYPIYMPSNTPSL